MQPAHLQTLTVDLAERSYPIAISGSALERFDAFVAERTRGRKALVITDQNVLPHAEACRGRLQRAGFVTHLHWLRPGEEQKCLARASELYDVLAEMRADRQTLVIAIGGGVIGDLAGFVAATFNRGLPLLMVPTSLLAMVDSSVGGKVGINHPKGKNLIGAFHQPNGVWIDVAYLSSLPEREYLSGLAEVVKYGVILDPDLFAYLEEHAEVLLRRDPVATTYVVTRSCQLKASVVQRDERETTGLRTVLNYGHTFAHAFEVVGGYGLWLHGEAVAAGMICASRLAERLGLIGPHVTERQLRLLRRFELPVATLPSWSLPAMLDSMRSDKKAEAGQLRFVLPTRLGEVVVRDGVPEEAVVAVLRESSQ